MKRSFASLGKDDQVDNHNNPEPPTKKRKSDVITQTDINQFYLAVAKCDVKLFDKILFKLDKNEISRKTIKDWVFKQHGLDNARDDMLNGTFNENLWDPYKTQDVKLMLWIVERFGIANNEYAGGEHISASNCYMSMIFAMLFEQTKSSRWYTSRSELGTILKANDMIYIIDTLQRDCGCCFLNEDYDKMFVVIRSVNDWDILDVDDFFKIVNILNVNKIEIEDISLNTYNNEKVPWTTTLLNHVTLDWDFNYDFVKYFFAPLIENGARMWPLTEMFQESTLMMFDHDDDNKSTDTYIKNMIENYCDAIFEDTDKWVRILDIDGKGDMMIKEMNDKNDDVHTHIGDTWHWTYNLSSRDSPERLQKAIKFCKGILIAKKKYCQKKRKGISFLMGTHDRVGKNGSIYKFINSKIYDKNLMKIIFSFAGLFPFQPHYL